MGEFMGILALTVLAIVTEYIVAWAGSVLSSISSEEITYATFTFRDDRCLPMTTNILMNVCIPNVAMIFIFMAVRKLGIPFVEPYLIWYVIAFFLFRMVLICVFLRRKEMYSPGYELGMAGAGIALAYFLIHFFFAAEESVFITASELREELWFVVLIVLYQFFKMIFDKNVTQNKVLKKGQITRYIVHKFDRFFDRYQQVLDINADNRYICILLFAVMIFEDYNRGPLVRRLERFKFRFAGKATLGIMQLPTDKVISDEESVAGFYNWLEREAGEDTQFERDSTRIRDLAWKYNNDGDYAESVTYIYDCLYEYIDRVPRYRALFRIREEMHREEGVTVKPYQVVTVGSREEFMQSLRQHVFVKCGAERLDLIEKGQEQNILVINQLQHAYYDGNGCQMFIREVVFQNCSDIALDNWMIRSADGEAAVLRFINCMNVRLKHLDLSGGGLCRIDGYGSSLTMQDCRIHDCAKGAVWLQDGESLIEELRIFSCHDSDENIMTIAGGNTFLRDVQIYENHTSMFAFGLAEANVICKDVEVRGNVFAGLSDGVMGEGVREWENTVAAAG